jgi:hypothetical protein
MPRRPTPKPEPELESKPDPNDTRLNVRLDQGPGRLFREAAEALGIDKTALTRMIVTSYNTGAPMPRNPLLTTTQER